MPRAKIADTRLFYTTRTAADRLGVSPYLVKSRITAGIFPPPTRISDGGVILLDEAWLQAAERALEQGSGRRGRRSRRDGMMSSLPTPESVLGYRMGADRKLPNWSEIHEYFDQLGDTSDRVTVEVLGDSTQGNPFLAVAISAPENLTADARQRNRALLQRLWDPRSSSESEQEEAIAQGKSVAIILATQHSNEIGACLMTLELAHQLAAGQDPATREVLQNTMTILIPSANPDGIELIVDWYRRMLDTPHEGCEMPWLYHKYVGHDNNRDWFMLTQIENRHYAALHNREHPQLVFDMHQMYRDGARFMVPPFIDPLDPNQDPVIQQGFAALGSAIAARLTAAGKPGVATHIIFDNYSPSLAYGNYHGSVDLLSEAASCRLATPVELKEKDLKDADGFNPRERTWNHPLPWPGGTWTLRDIVEYDLIAARAFLEHAAKYRAQWLRDYLGINTRTATYAEAPSAFVIPADDDQRDPGATAELIDVLMRGLVEVDEAKDTFTADGIEFPTGTKVVRVDQPAGKFAKTLLEVQDYPNLRKWPDGPPVPPYDIAGHTLPMQMGVRTIPIRQPLDDKAKRALQALDEPPRPIGDVIGDGRYGWAFSPAMNNATLAISRLLAAGFHVHRGVTNVPGIGLPAGSILVPTGDGLDAFVRVLAEQTGITFHGLDAPIAIDTREQTQARLGLYQSWRPAIDEGWCRWVLETYEIPATTLHDNDIRPGNLRDRYDTILLPHQSTKDLLHGNPEKNDFDEPYPPRYVGGLGELGLARLQRFVEEGGTLVALDGVCEAVIDHFALPVRNVLKGLGDTDFYCPGSLLRIVIDTAHPLGWGLERETTVLFMKSPAFEHAGGPEPATVVARYPTGGNPNASGWILGEKHIQGKAALLEVELGEGRVILIGFRPQFRAQARGTYKIFFNSIARGATRPSRLELG